MNVFLLSLCVCLGLLPILGFIAKHVGLVDEPSSRKRHDAPTPLVGGLCVFISFALTVFFIPGAAISWTFIGWIGLVLAIGVVDDYADISHRIRLLLHALIVVGIAITEGLYVSGVGAITGGAAINFHLYPVAVAFTIVGVLGAINAVNMSDGVDGLLGFLLTVSLVAVVAVTWRLEVGPSDLFSRFEILALVGALLAFLAFNSRVFFKRAMLFFGDAGSTAIGFLLIYVLIHYAQAHSTIIRPVLAGWIVGLPLLDASAVIATRILSGKSPFSADRTHLHHLLLDRGWTVNRTVVSLVLLHTGLICFAIAMSLSGLKGAEAVLFWGFIGLVFIRVVSQIFQQRRRSVFDVSAMESERSVSVAVGVADESVVRRVKRIDPEVDVAKPERSGAA